VKTLHFLVGQKEQKEVVDLKKRQGYIGYKNTRKFQRVEKGQKAKKKKKERGLEEPRLIIHGIGEGFFFYLR